MTDEEHMAGKEKKFEVRTFIYFGLAFVAIGIFLHLWPNQVIGLPVAHADYAKELELTLMWGTLFFLFGVAMLGIRILWWLCDCFEPAYRAVENEWRTTSAEKSANRK